MEPSLLDRWEGEEFTYHIIDEGSLALVRDRIRNIGQAAGLSRGTIATAALIATELGQNQIRHADYGEILVKIVQRLGKKGIEVRAADEGPGILRPDLALIPKPENPNSMHAGLSAVFHLSDEVTVDNRIGEGLCISAHKFDEDSDLRFEVAIYGRPKVGESVSGDDATFLTLGSIEPNESNGDDGFLLGIADGFGHGPLARESSSTAMNFIKENSFMDLTQLMQGLVLELRGKRGVMLAVCRFDLKRKGLEIIGSGDISGVFHQQHGKTSLFFRNSPFGSHFRPKRYRASSFHIERGDLLVLHTDGVRESFDLTSDGRLLRRSAFEIAHELVERFGRENDDALAVVVRFA